MDNRIEVRTWDNVKSRNVPPQIIINLDADDIELCDTVTTVLIKKNGKVARINLLLAQHQGKLKASVTADGLQNQVVKTVSAKFCWEINQNGDLDYPCPFQ